MKTSLELSRTFGLDKVDASTWSADKIIEMNVVFGKRAATAIWIRRNIIEARRADTDPDSDKALVRSITVAPRGTFTVQHTLEIQFNAG